MAKLGMARLHVEQDAVPEGVKEIGEVWRADANFLRVNAALFNAGLPRPKRAELQRVLEERQATNDVSQEVLELFRNGAATERSANMSQDLGGDVVSPVSGGKARPATPRSYTPAEGMGNVPICLLPDFHCFQPGTCNGWRSARTQAPTFNPQLWRRRSWR